MTGAETKRQNQYVLGVVIGLHQEPVAKMAYEASEAMDDCIVLTAEEAADMDTWIEKAEEYLVATGALIHWQEAGHLRALLTPEEASDE